MGTFLEEVCDHILEHLADQTGDVCVVTPNRRAGLFFRKYFSRKISRTTWAPGIISIEDFVNKISGLQICDNVSLMFEFYKVYQNIEKENARSIDEFFRWAPVLLRNFDEIDAQLDDPKQLFGYLKDLKRIESWNPDGSPLTSFQKQYLEFFEKFEQYHVELVKHLLDQKLAYQGLSFRLAANKVKEGQYNLPWKKIIFAGFNALTQSEETIINSLYKQKTAKIISDSDPYYLDDPMHEAGYFIRRYQNKYNWNATKEKVSGFSGNPKKITILGIAKNVNQARLAGNLLAANKELTPDENTAIVLANENLLIPTLYSLPGNVSSVNVTMGYPLKKTNLYGFFNALFQLYLTPERLRTNSSGNTPMFYYKDVIRLFGHQAMALLWDINKGNEYTNQLLRKLAESNYSFCSFAHLASLSQDPESFKSKFGFLNKPWGTDISQMTSMLLEMIGNLDNCYNQKAEAQQLNLSQSPWFLDYESLYYFSSIIRRLKSLIIDFQAVNSLKTFQMLFRLVVNQTRLAFSGEPLEGLQIMGMLETRNLDFKNIILLSANEDILPKGKSNNSFIPFDVKKKFNLQVHTDKDATYGYHFYRLLQRASSIYILYNTQKGAIGNQEKSRYITQLNMELPKFNPETILKEEVVSLSPSEAATPNTISIEKSPAIMERLAQMASTGFSPSALSSYINCPLQFYMQKVARLEEADQVEETLEASTMGTVIHATLESLYKDYKGQVIDHLSIEKMKARANEVLLEKFREEFEGGNINSGKNLLLVKVAERILNNFLEKEKHFLQNSAKPVVTILELEEQLQASLDVNVNGESSKINIRGWADRIDMVDGTIRIIDYKTGKTERSELTVKDPESVIQDPKMAKTFQLLCYTWLYQKGKENGGQIQSGIFSMKNMGAGLLTVETDPRSGLQTDDLTRDFQQHLSELLSDIMNPEIPFEQASEQANCRFCVFRVLCNRF